MFFREQGRDTNDYSNRGELLKNDLGRLMKGDDTEKDNPPKADADGGKDKPPPRDRVAAGAAGGSEEPEPEDDEVRS